jgi:hypothetical protein
MKIWNGLVSLFRKKLSWIGNLIQNIWSIYQYHEMNLLTDFTLWLEISSKNVFHMLINVDYSSIGKVLIDIIENFIEKRHWVKKFLWLFAIWLIKVWNSFCETILWCFLIFYIKKNLQKSERARLFWLNLEMMTNFCVMILSKFEEKYHQTLNILMYDVHFSIHNFLFLEFL